MRASEMEPIRLKGISRDVLPYSVEDIHTEGLTEATGFFNETGDGVRLFLDINRLAPEQAAHTADMLATMLVALERKKLDGEPE